jgi:hypothetical protein
MFKNRIWYCVRSRSFSISKVLQAEVVYFKIKVGVEWDVRVTSFINDESIKVVPRILSNATSTVWLVVRLIIACGNCWLIDM